MVSLENERDAGDTARPSRGRSGPLITRRRLLIAVPLVVLVLGGVGILIFNLCYNLKSRMAPISVGMHRDQVEEILGKPVLDMDRTGGKGKLLCWVDQLWQVDVILGPDDRVERTGCMPSDSMFRGLVRGFVSLFK